MKPKKSQSQQLQKKKKMKKKKEKEKAAKVGAADKPAEDEVVEEKNAPVRIEETKAKASDKKVPKYVREMQEPLAQMKEVEEKTLRIMDPF